MSLERMVYSVIVAGLLLMNSATQAFIETPKFSQLRLLYPGYRRHGGKYTPDDVMQLVLGVNGNASAATLADRESLRGGAAAVRLSWTLNRYGGRHAIGRHPVVLSGRGKDSFRGADGQQYIYRNEAFGPYLAARYGDPVVQRPKPDHDAADQGRRRPHRRPRPSWPAVVGRQGIVRVVRYVGGREDGHVGLWDCDRFHESRDWSLDAHVIAVEFWEAADSYCAPVSAHSHVSIKPRLRTLSPSVQIVIRHNFASSVTVDDRQTPRRTRDSHRSPDKLWLQ